jgi:hypothetical protein
MSSRRVESFLLRVVVQEDQSGADIWRGRIQHITTGSERQFEQFQEIVAFIAAHLGQIEALTVVPDKVEQ